nr:hypothetical protein [Clostridia bacterium]
MNNFSNERVIGSDLITETMRTGSCRRDLKYLPEGCIIGTHENREYISSFTGLSTALEVGAICEANAVLCDSSMTLTVDLGCMKGIIPREEVVFSPCGEEVKNIAIITRVGKPVC